MCHACSRLSIRHELLGIGWSLAFVSRVTTGRITTRRDAGPHDGSGIAYRDVTLPGRSPRGPCELVILLFFDPSDTGHG